MSIIVKIYGLEIEYCQGVYRPSDDSFLLADTLNGHVKGKLAIDIGSGTGIISLVIAKTGIRVIATDISLDSAKCTWNNAKRNNLDHLIDVICCDIICPLRPSAKLDVIASNPPYLLGDWREEPSIYGGISGTELIKRIILQSKIFIKRGAKLYLVVSSISNLDSILKKIRELNLTFNILHKKPLNFFEDIFVLKIYYHLIHGKQ